MCAYMYVVVHIYTISGGQRHSTVPNVNDSFYNFVWLTYLNVFMYISATRLNFGTTLFNRHYCIKAVINISYFKNYEHWSTKTIIIFKFATFAYQIIMLLYVNIYAAFVGDLDTVFACIVANYVFKINHLENY